jgi:hypothetical protein
MGWLPDWTCRPEEIAELPRLRRTRRSVAQPSGATCAAPSLRILTRYAGEDEQFLMSQSFMTMDAHKAATGWLGAGSSISPP